MQGVAYYLLIWLQLVSIGIKYAGSNTNPFLQISPSAFLFLTAIFCHAVASMGDTRLAITMIIFHVSGVVGCETLLWILLADSWWWWYIINLFLLFVTSLCFFNSICNIIQLLLSSSASSNAKLQEAQAFWKKGHQ